jgi:hypothetical protein
VLKHTISKFGRWVGFLFSFPPFHAVAFPSQLFNSPLFPLAFFLELRVDHFVHPRVFLSVLFLHTLPDASVVLFAHTTLMIGDFVLYIDRL